MWPACTNIGVAYQKPKNVKKQIYGLGRALEGVPHALPLSQLCDIRSEICISRLFVPQEQLEQAQRVMKSMDSTSEQYHLF